MYPTTDAYKAAIGSTSRTWALDLVITLDSKEVLNLTETDVMLSSPVFKEGATCIDNIQVGSTFANSFDFALMNNAGKFADYNFNNARCAPKIGLQLADGTFEYVPLGIFNIIKCGKKLTTIPLNGMDDMYKLNRTLAYANITFPTRLSTMFSTVCLVCGVSVSSLLTQEIAAIDYDLVAFDTTQFTCRDFVGFVGVLLGKNMRMNRAGQLEAFWYTNSGQTTTQETRLLGASYDDKKIEVTGVSITGATGNTVTAGTDAYQLSFTANPLIQTDDYAQTIANSLLMQLRALTYVPSVVPFMGDPSWQAGDIITHNDTPYGQIISPLMLHSFKFRGNASLEAKGRSPEENRQLTAQAKKLIDVQAKASHDLNEGLSGMQQTILQQSDLLTTSLGFYPKVIYGSNGSIESYNLMSTQEDSDTTTVWRFSTNGIGVSHTGLAGPYTSSWTIDDTIVAHMVTADMLRTGVIAALDNLLTIDLSNGRLQANTEKGSTTIEGNDITLQYWNGNVGTKPPVAYIKLTPDNGGGTDGVASMRIVFASNDGATYGYIGQEITHATDTGAVTDFGQLTFSHSKPILFDSSIEFKNSIVFDHMIMQRKSNEPGNTGVDFVVR